MTHDYMYETAADALPRLCMVVMRDGLEIGSRAGRVKEIQNAHVTLTQPWLREILTVGRKASLPAQIAETAWVLAGRDDVGWLSHYLPRAYDFSDDGKVWRGAYGPRLRNFNGLDQVGYVVDLLREDPLTRRAVIQIYDPEVDSKDGKDIPCNNTLQFLSRLGKLHLHVSIRSNDLMWGWSGINAFEWSTLQEIVAHLVGLEIGQLRFNIGSLHLYDRHWKKASKIIDYEREGGQVPIVGSSRFGSFGNQVLTLSEVDDLLYKFFKIEESIRSGNIRIQDIEGFSEPMLRSWLRALATHWSDDWSYMGPLRGNRTYLGLKRSPSFGREIPAAASRSITRVASPFMTSVMQLHIEKDKAYGPSWKKRGEMLGIMANIARKIDRLGVDGAGDTAADTAVDLMVYLAKYRIWLEEQRLSRTLVNHQGSDSPADANALMLQVEQRVGNADPTFDIPQAEEWLRKTFDRLEDAVKREDKLRHEIVFSMLEEAYWLARLLHERENGVDDYRGADHD